jgi:hypothetical protein
MILFGLYTGQRLGDIATLRWNKLDLLRGELPLRSENRQDIGPANGGASSKTYGVFVAVVR